MPRADQLLALGVVVEQEELIMAAAHGMSMANMARERRRGSRRPDSPAGDWK